MSAGLELFQFLFLQTYLLFFSRDRANFQLINRRLERKVKELMLQVDDEHLSLTDQKDQVKGKTNMQMLDIHPTSTNHHIYEIDMRRI